MTSVVNSCVADFPLRIHLYHKRHPQWPSWGWPSSKSIVQPWRREAGKPNCRTFSAAPEGFTRCLEIWSWPCFFEPQTAKHLQLHIFSSLVLAAVTWIWATTWPCKDSLRCMYSVISSFNQMGQARIVTAWQAAPRALYWRHWWSPDRVFANEMSLSCCTRGCGASLPSSQNCSSSLYFSHHCTHRFGYTTPTGKAI